MRPGEPKGVTKNGVKNLLLLVMGGLELRNMRKVALSQLSTRQKREFHEAEINTILFGLINR